MREPGGAAAEGKPLTVRDFKPPRRRVEQVDWPGTGRTVGLLYLHCDEIQAAYFAARRWFEDQGQAVDSVAAPYFELEYRYQLVQRMLLAGAEPARKLFPDVALVRRELTPNELDHFVGEHAQLETAEAASWGSEQRDPTLRQIARLLNLPTDTTTEQLLARVELLVRAGG